MVGIGSIIYVRNIVFQDATIVLEQVDHAFLHGRPCLVVDFDRDYLYFFPMTHVKESHYYPDKYIFDQSNCQWKRRKYNKHAVAISHYYKIPYTQIRVYGTLDPYTLAEVMDCYCKIHPDCYDTVFYQNLCYYGDVLKEIGPFSDHQVDYSSILTPYDAKQERYEFLNEFNDYLYDDIFSNDKQKTKKQ